MKLTSIFFPLAAMFFAINGCLTPETVENRIIYRDKNSPPEITVTWHNISSDAKNDKELNEDFSDLIKDLDSTNTEIFFGTKKSVHLKESQVYIANAQLHWRVSAVPRDNQIEDITSHSERLLVLDKEEAGAVKTNGTLLQTEHNYILVWPESLKEIYWTNHEPFDDTEKDSQTRRELNRPKLIKLFQAHQHQKK